MTQENKPSRSHLEDRLTALEGVYKLYGRDGLAKHPLHEIGMLLASKELQLRDQPRGRDLSDSEKASNRMLELEVKDITGLIHSQIAAAGIQGYRPQRQQPQPEQQQQQAQSKIFDKSR